VDEFTGVKRYSGEPPAHQTREVPRGGFPEISMWAPTHGVALAPLRRPLIIKSYGMPRGRCSPRLPLLGGIYEDLNKVLYAQFYWQKDRTADSIMDEYIAYEFSPLVVARSDGRLRFWKRICRARQKTWKRAFRDSSLSTAAAQKKPGT